MNPKESQRSVAQQLVAGFSSFCRQSIAMYLRLFKSRHKEPYKDVQIFPDANNKAEKKGPEVDDLESVVC